MRLVVRSIGPQPASRVSRSPQVSICIPTLDQQAARVHRCLSAIQQHTPGQLEVVIADCEGIVEGWTRPAAFAMRHARAHYLVCLNDDVLVTDGWLAPLLEALDNGAWCATPDGSHTDGPQVFHPYCMAFTRTSWDRIGGLDEQFVLWGSDIDLALRLVNAGHPPVIVKLPHPVQHELNATSAEHPSLGPIAAEDLERFRQKWGESAEHAKHRLAGLL